MANLESIAERFWSKVDRSDGPHACWPWTGHRTEQYGKFWLEGRPQLAHRVAWKLMHGEPPTEKPYVLHRCDNPPCCNQSHLFLGTRADNNADRDAKGRGSMAQARAALRLHPEMMARGEHVGTAKLTEAIVKEIRSRYAAGDSQRALGRAYRISQGHVSTIVRREVWKHIG